MYDFIVNPNARSGLGGRIWKELEQLLKEQKAEYRGTFYQISEACKPDCGRDYHRRGRTHHCGNWR